MGRRGNRGHQMPPRFEFVTGICRSGKRGYWTMAGARALAKQLKKQGGDPGVHAYDCPFCEYFHVGHLADGVRRGRLTKDQAYPPKQERAS